MSCSCSGLSFSLFFFLFRNTLLNCFLVLSHEKIILINPTGDKVHLFPLNTSWLSLLAFFLH